MSEESEITTIRVLTWSGKEEDWPMWSMKFKTRAAISGYDEIMDGTVTVLDLSVDIDTMKDPNDETQNASDEYKKAMLLEEDSLSLFLLYRAWVGG